MTEEQHDPAANAEPNEKIGEDRHEESSGSGDDGPDVSELDDEPDYNPDEPGLKDLKGG